jgi:hypothetical protein
MLAEHISKEWLEHDPSVKTYLLSKKCKDVFVPKTWEGIRGIPDLELETKPTLPSSIKAPFRPVNEKIYEAAKAEFERIKTYFHDPSFSPWKSSLVVAPKVTKPLICIRGNYITINNHIVRPH